MTPRRRAPACVAILAASVLVSHPAPADAAFDLRQASPEALGSASMDLPFDLVDDDASVDGSPPKGLRVAVSRASLYAVTGLAADRVEAGWLLRPVFIESSWSRTGTPDIAESIASVSIHESAPRSVSLRGRVERLSLGMPLEPGTSGWAAGLGVTARVSARHLAIAAALDGDRVVRSRDLGRLEVRPALLFHARLFVGGTGHVGGTTETRGIAIAVGDRWESDGRRSPRIAAEIPLGSLVAVRAGRGGDPGRIGIAVRARVGRLTVSAGRQDDAGGGAVTSAGVRFWFGGGDDATIAPHEKRPAEDAGRSQRDANAPSRASRSAEQDELLRVVRSESAESVEVGAA